MRFKQVLRSPLSHFVIERDKRARAVGGFIDCTLALWRLAHQQASFLKDRQPRRKRCAVDAQPVDKFLKPLRAQKRFAQDQQNPPVAEYTRGAVDRTGGLRGLIGLHGSAYQTYHHN